MGIAVKRVSSDDRDRRHLQPSNRSTALLLVIALAFPACRGRAQASSPADASPVRPNFVFFLVDDLGWGDVGFNGSSFYETPHIDALAAAGATFPNAYAACPVCSPTRGSIMTGRHPVRIEVTDWLKGMPENRIRDKRLLQPQDRDELGLEQVTIAEHLREHGYQTFFAGKWHLGGEGYWPEDQGFDENIGGCDKGAPGSYYAPWQNPKLPEGEEGEYLTDRLTDESIALLRERDDARPFLLYLSYYNVHTPIQANKQLVGHFQEKANHLQGKTPRRKEHTAKTRMRQDHPAYASMVAATDHSVGKVLAALDDLGLADDTVVIFFSDNGGLSTSQGPGPTCNLPLRAGKGWLYEGGVRVPMVVRAPHTSAPGTVVSTPVVSMDFFPTIIELAGLQQRPDLHVDGVSLVPLLQGDSIPERTLYWHYPHYHGSQWMPGASIREGDWKLVEHYHWDNTELFNLADDPGEQNDLSRSRPEVAQRLLASLHTWQEEIQAKLPVPNPDYVSPGASKRSRTSKPNL